MDAATSSKHRGVLTPSDTVVTTVGLAPATLTLLPDQTATMTATARNAEGQFVPGRTYTATSSDTGVATVATPGGRAVVVTVVAGGVCTITAHVGAVDSPSRSVTVSAPAPPTTTAVFSEAVFGKPTFGPAVFG